MDSAAFGPVYKALSDFSRTLSVITFVMLLLLGATMATAHADTLDQLAAKGQVIAAQDPLTVELRKPLTGPVQRGFDIGMAAAEGQTLPGPGKQKIHDSLAPEEQGGFDEAVSFSLDRNRNADLAKRGAVLAAADPMVNKWYAVQSDVFYKLGFNIGLAAAEGQTLPGPGKQKIYDALVSNATRQGFETAVSFSLDR